jgi:hypothetical protein
LRTIPPLIFREDPAESLPPPDAVVVCPVDDPIPAPWNFEDFRTDLIEGERSLAGKV